MKRGKKAEEDWRKALKVRQQSLETVSHTRKRRNSEGETVPTKSNKSNVLMYLSEKNEIEKRLKEKELELKEREHAARNQISK